jgi:phosphate starvation-inducible PhoH-like protein
MVEDGQHVEPQEIETSARRLGEDDARTLSDVLSEAIVQSRGRTVRPKTEGQKRYVQAIDESTIVFGIGPAGTGKTYLAMARPCRRCSARRSSASS